MPMASRKSWVVVNIQGTPAEWMLLSKWKAKKMILQIPTAAIQNKGPRPELPLRMMAISSLHIEEHSDDDDNDFNRKSSSEPGILHIHDQTAKLKRSQMKRQVTFQVSMAGMDLTQDCSLLPFFLQRLFHLMAARFIQMHETFESARAQNSRRVQLHQQGRKLTSLLKMWIMKAKSFLPH